MSDSIKSAIQHIKIDGSLDPNMVVKPGTKPYFPYPGTKKIAFVLIGTNKYIGLVENCIESLRKHLKMLPGTTVKFVVLTDRTSYLPETSDVECYYIDHLPWPLITLMRYYNFCKYDYAFSDVDYIYYIDADMLAVGDIGPEIIGNRVACQHPGLWGQHPQRLPFERNSHSSAFIDINNSYGDYYFGALQGGSKEEFLKMSRVLSVRINADLKENRIAVWHDESQMNRYFFEFPPDVVLGREFAHVSKWFGEPNSATKIVALDKDHNEFRKEKH